MAAAEPENMMRDKKTPNQKKLFMPASDKKVLILLVTVHRFRVQRSRLRTKKALKAQSPRIKAHFSK
jgi:hypothetical protein